MHLRLQIFNLVVPTNMDGGKNNSLRAFAICPGPVWACSARSVAKAISSAIAAIEIDGAGFRLRKPQDVYFL